MLKATYTYIYITSLGVKAGSWPLSLYQYHDPWRTRESSLRTSLSKSPSSSPPIRTATLMSPSTNAEDLLDEPQNPVADDLNTAPSPSDDPNITPAPSDDADIDSLVKRMDESVVIKDTPIKSPQSIQVPIGYDMDLELRPSEMLKHRSQVKREFRKRKRRNSLPNWSQEDWQNHLRGFRPEEVNWNGALCIDNCRESNLSNDIHPLLDRSCFDDTPDAIYNQLVPALRLATMFLTQPVCMQFWVTLAEGRRRNDPKMTASNGGKFSQRIDSHVELTAESAIRLIDYLKHVGSSKLIHFRFNRDLHTAEVNGKKNNALALSMPICDHKSADIDSYGEKSTPVRSLIRFHVDYYVVAKKLSQLKFAEVSQKLRFSFGFATLMVHEIAHSIEGIHFHKRTQQWLDWHESKFYKEPYWLDWKESECGRAWEESIYGGHVQPINSRVDGSHGIAVADWPFGGKDEDPKSYRWSTISMSYIEHMFQMSTWQRSFNLKDSRIFNIPRDGASSLFLHSFTIMKTSEEERVAKKEVAALLAAASKEPATKKQVMGLGDTKERRPDAAEVIGRALKANQGESSQTSPQKKTPMFKGTRRLSSVMPGALPQDPEGEAGVEVEGQPLISEQNPEGETSVDAENQQLLIPEQDPEREAGVEAEDQPVTPEQDLEAEAGVGTEGQPLISDDGHTKEDKAVEE